MKTKVLLLPYSLFWFDHMRPQKSMAAVRNAQGPTAAGAQAWAVAVKFSAVVQRPGDAEKAFP